MKNYGNLVQALLDLGEKTAETVAKAQAILNELEAEWSLLIDLADHFRYLCLWRDVQATHATILKLEAVLWHFEDLYLN